MYIEQPNTSEVCVVCVRMNGGANRAHVGILDHIHLAGAHNITLLSTTNKIHPHLSIFLFLFDKVVFQLCVCV